MLTPWGCRDGDLDGGCGVSHPNLERLVGWVGGRVSQAGILPGAGLGAGDAFLLLLPRSWDALIFPF